MKRDAYLAATEVRSFLSWARPFVTGDRALRHKWSSKRLGSRRFETLVDAYHQYDWPFSVRTNGQSSVSRRRTRDENVAELDRLSLLLRQAANQPNKSAFLDAAVAVVEWGGVRQNRKRLKALEPDALTVVCEDAERLDPPPSDADAPVLPSRSALRGVHVRLAHGCSSTVRRAPHRVRGQHQQGAGRGE